MTTRRFGPYTVETSNEDKVLFPESGVTKGDLIEYYKKVSDHILPHMRGRPVVMHRFPDGIGNDGFYQKDVPGHFPDWIERKRVSKRSGGSLQHVVCSKTATLVYLADQACIEPHVWLSRTDDLDTPDRLVFDLDPSGDDFSQVRAAARQIVKALEEAGLAPFAQTTGSRGIHIVAPLRPASGFDEVREFAQDLAKSLASDHPDRLTVEQRKDKRGDRVYIDTGRNAYAQTMVTPYAVRPRKDAPVATPIELDELRDSSLEPDRYTTRTIFRRLSRREDPWSRLQRSARSLAVHQDGAT